MIKLNCVWPTGPRAREIHRTLQRERILLVAVRSPAWRTRLLPTQGKFRDILSLRYGWIPNNTPQTCNCGAQFAVNHAIICHVGGFPTIHHTCNKIRDSTTMKYATMLLLSPHSNRSASSTWTTVPNKSPSLIIHSKVLKRFIWHCP